MTTTRPTGQRSKALNLASLVPPLPLVTLPNGKEVQLRHLSAKGYELYREMQSLITDVQQERPVDEQLFTVVIDELLALVLPDATPDDLASLGDRYELKMAPILAAAGRVDEVLASFSAKEEAEGNGDALSDLNQSTTSVAPSSDTAKPLDKTG